jgi:hypothetical protein
MSARFVFTEEAETQLLEILDYLGLMVLALAYRRSFVAWFAPDCARRFAPGSRQCVIE